MLINVITSSPRCPLIKQINFEEQNLMLTFHLVVFIIILFISNKLYCFEVEQTNPVEPHTQALSVQSSTPYPATHKMLNFHLVMLSLSYCVIVVLF